MVSGSHITLVRRHTRHHTRSGRHFSTANEHRDRNFTPTGVISASTAEPVKSSDPSIIEPTNASSLKLVRQIQIYRYESALNLAISPDERTLAVASDSGELKLVNLDDGQVAATLNMGGYVDIGHPRLTFSGLDGRYLAAVGGNTQVTSTGEYWGSVAVWDSMKAGVPDVLIPSHRDVSTLSVAASPDGRTLAVGARTGMGGGGSIILWDVERGQELSSLLSGDWVVSVAFSPDGRTLASSSFQYETELVPVVKLWSAVGGQPLGDLKGHDDVAASIAFAPDGRSLAAASLDGTVKIWDVASGRELRTLTGHGEAAIIVAFSLDGQVLASVSQSGIMILWDAATGRELYRMSARAVPVSDLAFFPNGRTLVLAFRDEEYIGLV